MPDFSKDGIDNLFSYHAPTPDQIPHYEAVRAGAKAFAQICREHTPQSADQSAGFRLLREAVFTFNASIAFEGPVLTMTRGGAARSARVAHTHEVAGSNPAPATISRCVNPECRWNQPDPIRAALGAPKAHLVPHVHDGASVIIGSVRRIA